MYCTCHFFVQATYTIRSVWKSRYVKETFHVGLCCLEQWILGLCLSPALTKSASSSLHSVLNWLAPVRLPSPPITHRLVMPSLTKLKAALVRPSLVRKSWQRALPITVPPWCQTREEGFQYQTRITTRQIRRRDRNIWNLSTHLFSLAI